MQQRIALVIRVRSPFATARRTFVLACLTSTIVRAGASPRTTGPQVAPAEVVLCGKPAPPPSSSSCGFVLIAGSDGPQVAVMPPAQMAVVSIQPNERVDIAVPIRGAEGLVAVSVTVTVLSGGDAAAERTVNGQAQQLKVSVGQIRHLEVPVDANNGDLVVRLRTTAGSGNTAVRWQELRVTAGPSSVAIPMVPSARQPDNGPVPEMPTMRPEIEEALIEWDWRMQDGIGTPRVPSTWSAAIERTFTRGDALVRDLTATGISIKPELAAWEKLRNEWQSAMTSRTSPGCILRASAATLSIG